MATEWTSVPRGTDTDLQRFRTFWQRVGAAIIDGCVLAPMTMPTTILIGYGPAPLVITWIIVTTPAVMLYTIIAHGHWGKTLGKHVTGLEVVRQEDEKPIGFGRAIRRDAATILFSTAAAIFMINVVASGNVEAFRIFETPELPAYQPGETFDFWDIFWSEGMGPYGEPWYLAVLTLQMGWGAAELVTMPTNRRRRGREDRCVVKRRKPLLGAFVRRSLFRLTRTCCTRSCGTSSTLP